MGNARLAQSFLQFEALDPIDRGSWLAILGNFDLGAGLNGIPWRSRSCDEPRNIVVAEDSFADRAEYGGGAFA